MVAISAQEKIGCWAVFSKAIGSVSFLVKLTDSRIIKHHQDYVRKWPSEHIQDTAESLMLGVPPCLSQAESP